MADQFIIKSAFNSPADEFNGSGKRPVVFDVYAPDRVTSLLPDDLKLVLHVNPTSMRWSYTKHIERTQMLGGYVETHWGLAPTEVSIEGQTGGFIRLYTGLSNITGPTPSSNLIQPASMQPVSTGGTRRESISYDKFLDLLALYFYNGAIYDVYGNIALQGQILMTYDGGSWWGWFTTFSVEESQEKPYQFSYTINFVVERELHKLRTVYLPDPPVPPAGPSVPATPVPATSTPTASALPPVSNPTSVPSAPTTGSTTSTDTLSDPAWEAASDSLIGGPI